MFQFDIAAVTNRVYWRTLPNTRILKIAEYSAVQQLWERISGEREWRTIQSVFPTLYSHQFSSKGGTMIGVDVDKMLSESVMWAISSEIRVSITHGISVLEQRWERVTGEHEWRIVPTVVVSG